MLWHIFYITYPKTAPRTKNSLYNIKIKSTKRGVGWCRSALKTHDSTSKPPRKNPTRLRKTPLNLGVDELETRINLYTNLMKMAEGPNVTNHRQYCQKCIRTS